MQGNNREEREDSIAEKMFVRPKEKLHEENLMEKMLQQSQKQRDETHVSAAPATPAVADLMAERHNRSVSYDAAVGSA